MHKEQGHEVEILASTETFVGNAVLGYKNPGSYNNEDGIKVTRLPYSKLLPHFVMKKLRLYTGIDSVVSSFKPDIIFLHDCQFLSIKFFAKYAKENPNVKVFVDGHTDMINSANNWISKNILHSIIYKWCANKIEPYTKIFWGVLPARVDFFINMYKLPPNKVKLLVMGAEDKKVLEARNENTRKQLREKFNISEGDFLIITGGKIDQNKTQVLLLMEAVNEMQIKNIKLLIFGSVIPELKDRFDSLLNNKVQYTGWINSNDVYKYFYAGELVVFPSLHSVLWEQAVGTGVPCVFKHIEGFTHVDVGGNCKFLYGESKEEIIRVVNEIFSNKKDYNDMKNIAIEKGMDTFSYHKISLRSIAD